MPTTKRVELIDKHQFARAALDKAFKTLVIYVVAVEVSSRITIHLSQAAQILI